MAEIKLFIATSLDGYIARPDGAIDWLNEIPNPDNSDFGYRDFHAEIDTVILGRSTYEEILGFDVDWPYPDCKTYVVTSQGNFHTPTPNTVLLTSITAEIIDQISHESSKNIWLVGGGKLIKSFLNLGAVDELIITIVSRIIGDGIPLFPSPLKDSSWKLTASKVINEAAVILTYRRQA